MNENKVVTSTIINDLQSRVLDIEYRLNHIVELPIELDIRLNDVERKIEGLGNSVIKLKKDGDMTKDTISCVDRAYDNSHRSIEKRLDKIEKHFSGD